MKALVRKYRREQPDARRDSLVEATIRCLAAHGHDGASVRRIAAEAGVSIGLINHHYASIDELIANAYEKVALGIVRQLLETMEEAPPSPRAKLGAFFRASCSPPMLDPDLLSVWVVFWSMIRHSPVMHETQQRTFAEYRGVIEQYLNDYAAEIGLTEADMRLPAIGLSALLDGIWLELCLNPTAFSPEEGIALCEAWIDGLASGAHRALLRGSVTPGADAAA
jgi:TetR/AcrR family transcriptional regulator, transcriptional repressor of bet genes